jgi:hypothetical protein
MVSETMIMGLLYIVSLFMDPKKQFLTVALALLKSSIVCQSAARGLVKTQFSIVTFKNLALTLWQPKMFRFKEVASPQYQNPSPLLLMSL